jgi:hypothetical protein
MTRGTVMATLDDTVTMGSEFGGGVTRPRPNVIPLPVRHERPGQVEREIVLELATADDLSSVMPAVIERIRCLTGAAGVEW